ncbi:hypothetical protein EJ02DRAFT_438392 [Clathrospora elynae]|uniref:Mid2 domain-containing protein n=1 Tax=Clathrospora elynae TaxID=706981 RepID=A0A6A5SA05_9PLEO|nr:hypothetical protein EJ02DRAFT_438392 [Clathrospora elynae]
MGRQLYTRIAALLACASTVAADYSDFLWSNSTYRCPGMPFECKPPKVCARNNQQKVYYCCNSDGGDALCWTASPKCDSESPGVPSGDQIPCSYGIKAFCCFKNSQTCTQNDDKISICWATHPNPIALSNSTIMNQTYQSLLSASPSAASYPIGLAALQNMTPTPSISSASSTSTTTSTTVTSSAAATSAAPSPDTGLLGGEIGGIVGGVIGGLALVGAAAFLLWRRRKKYSTVAQLEPVHTNGHHSNVPEEIHSRNAPPAEKDGYAREGAYVAELPANGRTFEMSADLPQR